MCFMYRSQKLGRSRLSVSSRNKHKQNCEGLKRQSVRINYCVVEISK